MHGGFDSITTGSLSWRSTVALKANTKCVNYIMHLHSRFQLVMNTFGQLIGSTTIHFSHSLYLLGYKMDVDFSQNYPNTCTVKILNIGTYMSEQTV